ncbi:unnamed protein product [Soboliphyme baturini]|uniref:Fucosyltransferase n=1 Tax=Soboliphyme baturini TaxID=241478 RepID=A0A183IMQ0_9BILA|nr:unnamed protein product [Soboliphyme baturini]
MVLDERQSKYGSVRRHSGKILFSVLGFVYFLVIVLRTIPVPWMLQATEVENVTSVAILAWTSFSVVDIEREFRSPLTPCPNRQCLVTTDRTMLERSDAIFFHERNLNPHDLPKRRRPDQYFVIANWEAPNRLLNTTSAIEKNFFNLTMTYRHDSDIFVPYLTLISSVSQRPLNEQQLLKLARRKKQYIAWFVSNCKTPSKRELYVRELQEHIPVDIYGRCGNLKCPHDQKACNRMLRNDYKFYLSFENSICPEYVTEKTFMALSNDVVPIVLSRAISQRVIPNDSFIAVDDFASPKLLADFLYYLSDHTTEYVKYFNYKRKYIVKKPSLLRMGMQKLCELISCSGKPYNHYVHNFHTWFTQDSNCSSVVLPGEKEAD